MMVRTTSLVAIHSIILAMSYSSSSGKRRRSLEQGDGMGFRPTAWRKDAGPSPWRSDVCHTFHL